MAIFNYVLSPPLEKQPDDKRHLVFLYFYPGQHQPGVKELFI